MTHALVFVSASAIEALFVCSECGWEIAFPLPGWGEPAAIADGGAWLPAPEGAYGEPACSVEPAVVRPPITREEFVGRFANGELATLLASADPVVKALLFRAQTREVVHLDSPEVSGGLAYLVSEGLLTSERAQEIQA